jgi:hypothetical protein
MNPMPVVMYLMGLEAEHGLLTELGFAKRPHPEGMGSSLYLREEALLHSTGLWYRGVLYHRPRERFYRAPIPPYPPAVHPEAEPLDFAEGLAHFLPFLKAYEDAVAQLRGEGRERFLRAASLGSQAAPQGLEGLVRGRHICARLLAFWPWPWA